VVANIRYRIRNLVSDCATRELGQLSFRLPHALLYLSVKYPGYLIVGCIVLAGAIWLAWAILRHKQLEKGFDEITAGATEREVLKSLGRPKRVEKCGEFFGPLPKKRQRTAPRSISTLHLLRRCCRNTSFLDLT
jgi:hypothetical protein